MKDIKNRLVLVTGGASGIGRLMGLEFAHAGARVVIWDLEGASIKKLEREAAAEGLSVRGSICDVSDREAVYRQADRLIEECGAPEILVNNAGAVSGRSLLEIPDEKIIRSINVNTLSLFWTTRAFLPSMMARGSGHIVTIASAAGLVGVRRLSDYSASKFAAFGFHESLRMELRHRRSRIRTTIVCPYYIDTGMFRGAKTRMPLLLPILRKEKVARAVVRGVLRNRPQVMLPPILKGLFLLRLLPVGIFDALTDFMGINNSMDDFREQPPRFPGTGKRPHLFSVSGQFRKAE